MEWVGIRELANRAGGVVDEVARSGRPALITKRGRPVAALVPIDEEGLEDWVLANAPEFTRSMAGADRDLAKRRTRPAFEVLDELEARAGEAGVPSRSIGRPRCPCPTGTWPSPRRSRGTPASGRWPPLWSGRRRRLRTARRAG